MFLQLLINGLIAGAIYALVACGFSLIYSTNKFVHFAHGAIIVASGYLLFTFFNVIGINFYLSIFLTIIGGGLLGYLSNLLIYERLREKKASASILLIASIALLILIESLILMIFGADLKIILPFRYNSISFLGAVITPLQIAIIVSSLVLFALLFLLMKKTELGKKLRAVSESGTLVEMLGISSKKLFTYSFVIGSALGAIAGIFVALEYNLEPTMGSNLMVKGFTGAIVGGITSVPGSILGSFLLGTIENFGVWFLPSGYKDAIAFMLLFAFLLFRPSGILGKKASWKK
ncbi:MAG TPA: branched-chain amino acid ABC transporter permease [archaeon]|jgi:branched-chain amino acid transport system permease protein|nr:branched-chain amino acid ABC transporter permease [archaeon]HPV66499.1 branched-chain amino acid ABC transporter permease [archaeon]HRS42745.1 branched-chain amino acid ABC transporter permease [Candidatus Diapherotrites archaeon]